MGLSTARLVQEAGFPVTIYAAALPPDTTSNIAGGQFHPFAVFHEGDVTPEFMAQFTRALDYSWRRFQIMVGDDYGIRWLPTYVESDSPEAKVIANFPPINRMLTAAEHPFPLGSILRYDTMYVETGRYLRQMIRDVQLAGGRIEVRKFATPADIASLAGSARLQLHRPRQPRPVRRPGAAARPRPAGDPRAAARGPLRAHGSPGYMFPRADGILLGGTFERDVWDATPDPATIAGIIAAPQALLRRASAAPLEVAVERPRHSREMNYQTSIPQSGGEQAEVLKDKLTPKAIVAALNEHIVGQDDAKKAVAVALRNRWRRQQLSPELRDEVTPKNILMIGPTGCGKTEISRRLAKLADAPFVKVEATKFTEVGYVGRDVEQIARDLVEEAVRLERDRRRNKVRAAAEEAAMDKLLDALTGKGSSEATRQSFRQRFSDGSLDQAEVEIEVDEQPAMPFEIPGMGAQVFDLKSMMGKACRAGPAQASQAQGARGIPAADRRGSRQASRSRRHQPHRARRRRSQWHRLPRRDRQDRGQRRARWFRQPRGRPA